MNKTLKRIIAGITGTALACGGIVGGLYAYKGMNRVSVSVYPVNSLVSESYYFDMFGSGTGYGTVEADRMQNVQPSSTMQIREILVEEGQEVKKGDPLVKYDTTLTQLQIERAENVLDQKKLALQKNERALEIIKGLKPSTINDGYAYDIGEPAEPTPEPTPEPLGPEIHPQLLGGDGSAGNPYVYLWGTDDILSDTMLIRMADGNDHEELMRPETPTPAPSEQGENTENGGNEEDASGEQEIQTPDYTAEDGAANSGITEFISSLFLVDVFADTQEEAVEETAEVIDNNEDGTSPADSETPVDYGEVEITDEGDNTEVIDVTGTDEAKQPSIDPNTSNIPESENPDSGSYEPKMSYIRLECHESNNRQGAILFQWSMVVSRDSHGNIRILPYRSEYIGESPDDGSEPTDSTLSGVDSGDDGEYTNIEGGGVDFGGVYDDFGSGELDVDTGLDASEDYTGPFTAQEIKTMLLEKEIQVRDDTLEVKIQELALRQMKEEFNGDTIKAKTDGVVTTVNDMDIVNMTGDPLITISGSGGGYYLKFSVSELYLDSLSVGSTVKATDFSTDMQYDCEITEITYYPESGNDLFFSEGNQNVSYYPCRAKINGDGITEYAYCSISYNTDTTSSDGMYLNKMFVRRDGTTRYVYVRGEDGKLQKRNVLIGKENSFDYSVEIRSGLTPDEWIAFPYGSDVKEGAKTEESDLENLYGGFMGG